MPCTSGLVRVTFRKLHHWSATTHVTIDARMVGHSGIGTYIRTIVPRVVALRRDWTFSLLGDAAALRELVSDNSRVVRCTAPIYGAREQLELARRIPRGTHVYWAPHYNVPVLRKVRLVVTIHDLAHLRLPEYRGIARLYARTLFAFIRRRAAAIMCVSEFSRSEFLCLVGPPLGHIATVHTGVPPTLAPLSGPAAPAVRRPYFLYVGNAKPHKNLGTLLDALELVRETVDVRLAVVGKMDGLRTGDDEMLLRLRAADGVSLLGEISSDGLRDCMTAATALIVPSVYEGFGLPPLEAMALGCPAVVARAASLPEICGDGAAYFDPYDAADLARVMRMVLGDPAAAAELQSRGRYRVKRFDPDETARRVAHTLARAAGLRHRA